MTKRLESGRISSSDLISTGPAKINEFEDAVADIFDITQGTTLDSTPFGINSDGDITLRSDAYFPRLKGETSAGIGLAFWDDDATKEAIFLVDGGYAYIVENVGTPGGSQTLKKRMTVELTGNGVDEPGQDILDHKRVPSTMGSEGEYLAVNASGELVFTAPGSEPVTAACSLIRTASHTITNGGWTNIGFNTLSFAEVVNTDTMYDGSSDYIDVNTSGIYLVSIAAVMVDLVTDDEQGGLAWGLASTTPVKYALRMGGIANNYFTLTHSCVYPFTAGDKIYLMGRASGGATDATFDHIEISLARFGAAS